MPQQPNPQPPSEPVEDKPSLSIYIGLIIIAVILGIFAFMFKPDIESVSGLLLNIATELVGAVIILGFVEKRLRDEDVVFFQDFVFSFTKEYRTIVGYTKTLEKQILLIKPVARPEFDNLLEKNPKGFLLYGVGGSGKSTLVQKLTVDQCAKTQKSPRREKIPVFAPLAWWDGRISLEDYIRSTAQHYYVINDKTFNKWLSNNRLLVVLDDIDLPNERRAVIKDIQNFCEKYSGNSIILVGRQGEKICNLPIITLLIGNIGYEILSKELSPEIIESIGKELMAQLVEELGEHPLAIHLAAKLIASSNTPKEIVEKLLSDSHSNN
jgi:uncharacterized membrane protein YeaQ/YmgE (transglycosylase-associated protein family)